jgi:hypothetical protein
MQTNKSTSSSARKKASGDGEQVMLRKKPERRSSKPRLVEAAPELAEHWHPRLNGTQNPQTISASSTYKAWWLCNFGHEFERRVNTRVYKDMGCPLCKKPGFSGIRETRYLAELHPELTKQLSSKNSFLDLGSLRSRSTEVVWWTCSVKGHDDYQRRIKDRTDALKPRDCPICENARKKATFWGEKYPELAKQWHLVLNGKIDLFAIELLTGELFWWRCSKNERHEWQAKSG